MRATCTSDASLTITRTFTDNTGYDLANVWFSFLVKAETVGSGHCFMSLNSAGAIGKAWANGFGIWPNASKQMVQGVTHLAVVRYDCRAGSDDIYLWIDPDLGQEPSIEDADAYKGTDDIGVGGQIGLNIQGHGRGVYVFDELRVGSSWNEVIGLTDLDPDAPTPNPMTWVSEPEMQGDTVASMTCATASHPDGVEYFFEETSGNPGGSDSGWQAGRAFTDGGLQEGYRYAYRVKARNLSAAQNETAWSTSASTSVPVSNLINVDFSKHSSPVYSGAAATGSAGDVWNSTDAEENVFLTDLLDSAGNPTTADLSWSDDLQSSENPAAIEFGSTGHNDLMEDYAFTHPGATATVTISELPAGVDYTLYLYGVPDNDAQETTFTAVGANEGTQNVTEGNISDDNGLAPPDDYVIFTGNTGPSGQIVYTQTGTGSGSGYSGSNGFQLSMTVPPFGSTTLVLR
jgi:hypothetical protein